LRKVQDIAAARLLIFGGVLYTELMVSIPMSDAQFAAATNRLRADGIAIDGPSGTLSKDGITGKYQYADGKLTIEVTDRPFFIPLSMIESKLQAYFTQTASGEGR
jgi:hypothetical protein